jgi:hypothetical protein
MYSMHRQFFHNPMYYMDDLVGRGGTFLLTVVAGVMSIERRMGVPCKMEKTMGGGGSAGLDSAQSRAKQKGAVRAAHRRLKVHSAARLGGGGQCQWLRRSMIGVGGEGSQSQGRA